MELEQVLDTVVDMVAVHVGKHVVVQEGGQNEMTAETKSKGFGKDTEIAILRSKIRALEAKLREEDDR